MSIYWIACRPTKTQFQEKAMIKKHSSRKMPRLKNIVSGKRHQTHSSHLTTVTFIAQHARVELKVKPTPLKSLENNISVMVVMLMVVNLYTNKNFGISLKSSQHHPILSPTYCIEQCWMMLDQMHVSSFEQALTCKITGAFKHI